MNEACLLRPVESGAEAAGASARTAAAARGTRDSRQPYVRGSESDEGTESRSQLVVPCCDASELLYPAEKPLYHVTILVVGPVNFTHRLSVRQLRNDR